MYEVGQKVWFTPTGVFAVEATITRIAFNDGKTWIYAHGKFEDEFLLKLETTEGAILFYQLDEPFYCSIAENDGFIWPDLNSAMKSLVVNRSCPGRVRKNLLRWYRNTYLLKLRFWPKDPERRERTKRRYAEMKEMLDALPDKKVYIRRK